MSWLSTLIFGKDPGQSQTERSFEQSIGDAGAAAKTAQGRYQTDSAGFDPGAAFKEYASGAQGDFNKQLGQQLRDLGGKAVGQGRFDSGFYDADQGQVIRDVSSDFSNRIAQGALQTSGMRLGQIGQEGQYALGQSGMYNDLLAGQLDRETAKQNAKRQQRSDLWGTIGKIGGQIGAAALGG